MSTPTTEATTEPEQPEETPVAEAQPEAQAVDPAIQSFRYVPPPPGFLQTRWPGPEYAGGPAAWIAALVGGVATAVALPLSRPGVGWLIVGLVITLAVAHASRFGPKLDSVRERVIRVGWTILSLALLSVGTFLNASWLFIGCVLGAVGCGALALAGGRSVRGMIVAAVTPPMAAFRSVPWLVRGMNARTRARGEAKSNVGRILLAILVTIVLLLVFGALFASADASFAKLLDDAIPDLNGRTVFRYISYTVVGAMITAGGIYLVLAPPDLSGLDTPARRTLGRVELMIPIGALVLLFGAFVASQLPLFFRDAAYIKSTTGMTFADYAVSGFAQLVVVTILTLGIIGLVTRWAPKETAGDRLVLRILLGALILLSLVIVASAVFRMKLYTDAYVLTRERLFFGLIEMWLGLVFLFVLAAGIKLQAKWFPRVVIASFALLLLGLAAVNPERYIARQNVDIFEAHQSDPQYLKRQFDLGYLQWLTTDAIEELDRLPEPYYSCAMKRINDSLKDQPDQWYSWNASREAARAKIAAKDARPIDPDACSDWYQYRTN